MITLDQENWKQENMEARKYGSKKIWKQENIEARKYGSKKIWKQENMENIPYFLRWATSEL